MPSITVKVDFEQLQRDVESTIRKKIDSAMDDKSVKYKIASKWAELINRFVPMDSGQLRSSAHVTPSGNIRYSAISKYGEDYAKWQYDSPDPDSNEWKRHTPGTGGHWSEYAQLKTGAWDDLCIYAEKIITEAMNKHGR